MQTGIRISNWHEQINDKSQRIKRGLKEANQDEDEYTSDGSGNHPDNKSH